MRGGELGDAAAVSLDVTGFIPIRRPLAYWFSGSGRLVSGAEGVAGIPCIETGVTLLFVTLGGGVGVGVGPGVPLWSAHAIVATPIPLWVPYRGHLLYIAPYWRPAFDITGSGMPPLHELGIYIKWLFAFLSNPR